LPTEENPLWIQRTSEGPSYYSCAEMPDKDETASTSLRTIIDSANAEWDDVVFMEQEETRSIRIPEWLFIRRFEPTPYEFGHLLYDLANDPDERNNVAEEPEYQAISLASGLG